MKKIKCKKCSLYFQDRKDEEDCEYDKTLCWKCRSIIKTLRAMITVLGNKNPFMRNNQQLNREVILNMDDIQLLFSSLQEKERKIILMRYGITDGVTHTLEEVGKEFGVTRERIRQIEAKAHEKMRQIIKGVNISVS